MIAWYCIVGVYAVIGATLTAALLDDKEVREKIDKLRDPGSLRWWLGGMVSCLAITILWLPLVMVGKFTDDGK